MKHILLIIVFVIGGSCKAQSPVLSLYGSFKTDSPGAYYKDVDNDLDKFVGSWKYTNGTTSLIITLQKKLMQELSSGNFHFFEDIIIGEYKYIENGIEKINSLPQLSSALSPDEHSIAGNGLIGASSSVRKLITNFYQANRYIPGMEETMLYERVDSGGVQKLKLIFKMTEGPYTVNGQPLQYTSYSLPFGEYLLVKQ